MWGDLWVKNTFNTDETSGRIWLNKIIDVMDCWWSAAQTKIPTNNHQEKKKPYLLLNLIRKWDTIYNIPWTSTNLQQKLLFSFMDIKKKIIIIDGWEQYLQNYVKQWRLVKKAKRHDRMLGFHFCNLVKRPTGYWVFLRWRLKKKNSLII